jgi:hypothetical protein
MTKRVPLTALSRELTALTGQPAPGYRKLWTMVVNGELPAEQVNGRYTVDVRAVAQTLGLTERVAA